MGEVTTNIGNVGQIFDNRVRVNANGWNFDSLIDFTQGSIGTILLLEVETTCNEDG